ncbi:MAG: C-terminal binding protein [Ruminococcaceae bacterium]|nr:C-terminal binding protein [Oscillospiraceae bacterium]
MKIVALSGVEADFQYELDRFSKRPDADFSLHIGKSKEEMMHLAAEADILLINAVVVDREMIDCLKHCKLIIRYGIGFDTIDYTYAAQKNIIVCNAPNYGAVDVAEHAVSLLLSCAKRLTLMNDCVREGKWNVSAMGTSWRLAGKTIGIVGFGRIARNVCTRTNAFGLKALVYDPYVSQEVAQDYGAKAVSLDELLEQSDFVTLHLPLMESTYHLMSREQFRKMKKTAIFINTSRGGLVCEADLVDALEQKEIWGAGLDVFEKEQGMLDSRLLAMPNVTLTPHIAWNTCEAFRALHEEVTENVVRFLDGNRPESIVNGL